MRAHARMCGELGEDLAAFVRAHAHDWDRAAAAMPMVAATADTLTQGVIHRDLSTQNTGWRHGRSQLLLFDLAQMAVGPLAQDAQALFPEGTPFDQDAARRYLTALSAHGGARLTLDDLIREVDAVRPLARLNFLWWATARSLDGKVDFTKDIVEGKRWYRNTLLHTVDRAFSLLTVGGATDAR